MTRVQIRSQEVLSSKSHTIIMNECFLLASFSFYAKLYLVNAAYLREAAKFDITRGYTADISLNRTVLKGITTGLVRRNFVLRVQ